MKKVIAVFFVLCLLTVPLLAQGDNYTRLSNHDFTVGLWGGLNHANLNFDKPSYAFAPYEEAKNGFMLGVTLEKPISNLFTLQSGVFYNQAGAKSEKQVGTNESNEKLGEFFFKESLEYLDIPLTMKLYLKTNPIETYFLAGPSLHVLMSAQEKSDFDYESEFDYENDIKSSLKKYTVSMDFGIGTIYRVTNRIGINAMVKYTMGLNNQISDSIITGSQKTRDLKVLIGPSFSL